MSENYSNPIGAKVQTVIFDCDRPEELATFYAKLLGGEVESDHYGGCNVSVPGLGIDLGFQEDEAYAKPVWLGAKHDQQPMLHLDIKVNDRQKATEYALSLGAVMPEQQFCQPEWDVQWTTFPC